MELISMTFAVLQKQTFNVTDQKELSLCAFTFVQVTSDETATFVSKHLRKQTLISPVFEKKDRNQIYKFIYDLCQENDQILHIFVGVFKTALSFNEVTELIPDDYNFDGLNIHYFNDGERLFKEVIVKKSNWTYINFKIFIWSGLGIISALISICVYKGKLFSYET